MKSSSYISKIPVELLEDIFNYVVCHPTCQLRPELEPNTPSPFNPHTANYRSCASPYAISHVCTLWRMLVISMPNLWTNLRVNVSAPGSVLSTVFCWVKRSGSRPLSLTIREFVVEPRHSSQHDTVALQVVLDLLFSAIERWKIIELCLETSFGGLVPFCIPSSTPALIDSSIPSTCVPQFASPKMPLTLLASVGRLSPSSGMMVLLDSARDSNLNANFWGRALVELTITHIGVEDLLGLFTSLLDCSNLLSLTLRKRENYYDVADGGRGSYSWNQRVLHQNQKISSSILLPCLTALRLVSFEDSQDVPQIFDAITLPSLRSLRLDNSSRKCTHGAKRWSRLGPWTWHSLSSMLERSDAKLRILTVDGIQLDVSPMGSCGGGEIWQPYWR